MGFGFRDKVHDMDKPYRIALKLDLKWPCKRHPRTFAGIQQYADEKGWETIIDEFVKNPKQYDGLTGRATKAHANQAVPVVNIWFNSPAKDQMNGVFPDYPACGRIRVEHFLDRGFRNFAALIRRGLGAKTEALEFFRIAEKNGFPCPLLEVASDTSKNEAIWQKSEDAISKWMDNWVLPVGVHVS